jgi:hypothetical protein
VRGSLRSTITPSLRPRLSGYQEGTEFSGARQLQSTLMLIYWAKKINAIKRSRVLDINKEVGLEVNAEETKYVTYLVTRIHDKFII